MNIIIVAEGAIDREGNAITPHAVKEVIDKMLAMDTILILHPPLSASMIR